MKKSTFGSTLVLVMLVAMAAWARETFLDLPVKEALASPEAKNLLDVPFFMAGQKHATPGRTLGEYKSNKRTNAFNKSDCDACHIAFLSALISLQERARREGGNAVIGVRSVTKNKDLESATEYRCVAGTFVANVALMGTVAEVKK